MENSVPVSCGRSSGKKSILSASASFAAVRKEKFTSWCSTLVMYGRDTFMRRASSVCETPSSFIRRKIRRRNAEPILSIAFIVRSWSYELELEGELSVPNAFHLNTYSRVVATTFFLTFSQVKLLPSISGIGSSSASSKYIKPLKGKDSSETENFFLYKSNI